MPTATMFSQKVETAYTWFANAVASEDPGTANHAQRLKVAREMVSNEPVFHKFIMTDFWAQDYDINTPQETINNRLSALATNFVNLGFGD